MFFKEVLLHNNECLFNVAVLIENIIPQKSSMPRRAKIYTNLIFFVIGRRSIFLPCVKNLEKLSHPVHHKMIVCIGLFCQKMHNSNLQFTNILLLSRSE